MSFYEHFSKRERNKRGIRLKKNFAAKVMKLSQKYCNNINSIMEIGPGDGYIADLSKNANIKYLGFEASIELSDSLKARGFDILQQFVPPLPKNIGQYSVCIALHVFEHMDDFKKASQLLQDIYKNLQPGGLIIIACPDYYRWGKFFFDCDYTHSIPFTMRTLNQLIVNERFEVVFKNYYVGNAIGTRFLPLPALMKFLYADWMNRLISPDNNLLYRLFLTFLPNLLFIAKKPE
jgi:SAM-dependent methyltransferase